MLLHQVVLVYHVWMKRFICRVFNYDEKIIFLTYKLLSVLSTPSSGVRWNIKGNSVQFGDGPAAVTEDERCINVTDRIRLGRRSQ